MNSIVTQLDYTLLGVLHTCVSLCPRVRDISKKGGVCVYIRALCTT